MGCHACQGVTARLLPAATVVISQRCSTCEVRAAGPWSVGIRPASKNISCDELSGRPPGESKV
jgi:hypothetical protein